MSILARKLLMAGATFPVVETTSTSIVNTNVTTHPVTMPAGVAAGDLLLVLFTTYNTTVTPPAGWTQLFFVGTGTTARSGGYYKVSNGTEGSSVNFTTANTRWSTHNVYRISRFQGVPESATDVGTSVSPDPPSLSPSWGAAKTLFIASAGYFISSPGTSLSSSPASYTDGLSAEIEGGASGDMSQHSARRPILTATEDPGVFTTAHSVAWRAATIAIRPA